jgi:hypothetical protein
MIYASSRGCAASGYYGRLKVLRKTDGRLLFPFAARKLLDRSQRNSLPSLQRKNEASTCRCRHCPAGALTTTLTDPFRLS